MHELVLESGPWYTCAMTTNEKYERLRGIIKPLGKVVVTYSGGADSSLVLKACVDTLSRENVIAFIGASATYPRREIEQAKEFARSLGAEHVVCETAEFSDENFLSNSSKRCYFCKLHLFEAAERVLRQKKFLCIVDGSNVDDLRDFRPGMKAVEEKGVISPLILAGISKADVREISTFLNLATARKPSLACLASRLPYGTRIERRILRMIEEAEEFISGLGVSQVRVRYHGPIARIEVPQEEMGRVWEERKVVSERLKSLGFVYVSIDLEGYRAGSMNEPFFHSDTL